MRVYVVLYTTKGPRRSEGHCTVVAEISGGVWAGPVPDLAPALWGQSRWLAAVRR